MVESIEKNLFQWMVILLLIAGGIASTIGQQSQQGDRSWTDVPLIKQIEDLFARSVPIGTILPYGGTKEALASKEDSGWMICDGRQLEIAQYPELFEALDGPA